jgi:adenosylmethionine-8-amino-7-oxononanoate aminotransferase
MATLAAMAASGISFTQAFEGMFIDVVRIPAPEGKNESYDALRAQIKTITIMQVYL